MSIAGKGLIPQIFKTTQVCIYSYDNKILKGYFENIYNKEKVVFSCLVEFILSLNTLYDNMNYPQSSTQLRSFDESEKDSNYEHSNDCAVNNSENIVISRFDIAIVSRFNSDWQGKTIWSDTNGDTKDDAKDDTKDSKAEVEFKSTLELINIIDKYLCKIK